MKVAFCHDWLNGMRGGEKCLEALCEDHPQAPIYTLFSDKAKISDTLLNHPIRTSFIQRVPGVLRYYRNFLPLFPLAVESFDLKEADVVVSTSHCVAKAVKKPKGAKHLCYCFSPMRYAWSLFDDYFSGTNFFKRNLIGMTMSGLKRWDLNTAGRVDRFVAISAHIRDRIRHCYDRTADVIYPPVDTVFYSPDPNIQREDFYLIVSALVPYKRIDLAVSVFSDLGHRLIVIGDGPERRSLEKQAGSSVSFLGWRDDGELRNYYRRARALIFPGEEDFGIVPVEAQACGCPVIAYAKGGALETVLDKQTGLFFDSLSADSLKKTLGLFESERFSSDLAVKNAARFGRNRFKEEMRQALRRLVGSE